jgi:hypothetical protein
MIQTNMHGFCRTMSTGLKSFKQNPTVKGMKRFLTETIISDSRGSTPSKFKPSQLLAELEYDEDE